MLVFCDIIYLFELIKKDIVILKRIKKSSELLWLFGIIFVALGVAICSKADLGVSMIAAPAFVVSESLSNLWSGFSVGVTEYILQGVLLAIVHYRKKIQLERHLVCLIPQYRTRNAGNHGDKFSHNRSYGQIA